MSKINLPVEINHENVTFIGSILASIFYEHWSIDFPENVIRKEVRKTKEEEGKNEYDEPFTLREYVYPGLGDVVLVTESYQEGYVIFIFKVKGFLIVNDGPYADTWDLYNEGEY